MDYATALTTMQRFCAYQERCHAEVRTRLIDLGVYGEELEQIISELIQENFLDEERFARAFARGKHHIKKWGRLRIENELKFRKISTYCIQKAMGEIEEAVYKDNLRHLLNKKAVTLELEENQFKIKQKLFQYALQKGYESDFISMMLKEIFPK